MPTDWYALPAEVYDICLKADPSNSIAFDYDRSCTTASYAYNNSIYKLKQAEKSGAITNAEFKRAREVLRGQLPTSGMVERTTIMNLRSFANYQKQRNSSYAQPEIRQVAQLMLEEVKKAGVAPVAVKTLESIGWNF